MNFCSLKAALLFFSLSFVRALDAAVPTYVPAEIATARSFSGQFVVQAWKGPVRANRSLSNTNQEEIRLEPTLVTISCERIKQLLCRDLDAGPGWTGKIYVGLYPAQTADQPVTILAEKYRDGWQYRVRLPDLMQRVRYVRTIVRVLLLEFANRTAGTHSAEIPAWLSEGLTQQLLASNEIEIILPPPGASSTGPALTLASLNARRDTPQLQAQKKLQSRPPLAFDELSWPTEEQWFGDAGEVYRASAQLFVNGLLQLQNGRSCMRTMLAELPKHYNWQLGFLSGFHIHFERILDIEKWWSLQILHFTGRDVLSQTWSVQNTLEKLDQVLHTEVELHTGTNELPLHTTVSLQKIIREWDPARQFPTIEAKIRELGMIRTRVSQEYGPLVDDYRQLLQLYLQRQDKSAKKVSSRAAQETLGRLDELDSARAMTRIAPQTIAARKSK